MPLCNKNYIKNSTLHYAPPKCWQCWGCVARAEVDDSLSLLCKYGKLYIVTGRLYQSVNNSPSLIGEGLYQYHSFMKWGCIDFFPGMTLDHSIPNKEKKKAKYKKRQIYCFVKINFSRYCFWQHPLD